MSKLYIRLPSKAAAGSAPDWPAIHCPFAVVSRDSSIVRQGVAYLPDLSGAIAAAQRVVLLLAASDVAVLRVKVPPLSPARLKAALPNLVEDQLIGDPSDWVIVASHQSQDMRTVAVTQRDWLEMLFKTLTVLGARRIAALPAQLCLPSGGPGSAAAAVNKYSNAIDVALRMSEHDCIGLTIGMDQDASAASEVIRSLRAVLRGAPVVVYVPQSEVAAYQESLNDAGVPNERISVLADSWSRWIAGAHDTTVDLMAGLGAAAGLNVEWRAWRWPLALAGAILVVNVAALNIDWWRMKNEADWLRATMIETYKSAFPKETVIIDPVAQMQQKIAAARRKAGFAAPDDFIAITAAFGEAWSGVATATGGMPAIAALEYRERSLLVRLKPRGELPAQQMKAALAARNLSLELDQSGPAAWKIRSAK